MTPVPDGAPAAEIVTAFGGAGEPVWLGGAWRAGPVVLKPVTFLPETLWRAEVLASLPESPRFRLARPIQASGGGWVVRGWEASRLVAGEPDVRRPDDALRAGAAFHAAVAHLPRPAFLDDRDDPWTHGDRVAWAERPVTLDAAGLLEPLVRARRPIDLPSQAVHGDLAGNVLFAPGLPPAIIDWPVYWRPAAWASAITVVDALCWYGAAPALAARWAHLPEWGQLLIRALIYRIVTDQALLGGDGWTRDRVAAYRPVADLAVTYAQHPG